MSMTMARFKLQRAVRRTLVRIHVDATDGLGRTPLHLAARHGDCEVARRLLAAGANVLAQTVSDQLSILEVAVKARHRTMVQLLLSHGAEFDPDKLLPMAPTDIQQVLIEHIQLTRKPRSDSKDVDNKFWGRIADVSPDSRDYCMKPVTVDQILAPEIKLDELMLGDGPIRSRAASIRSEWNGRSVRWIHLPENNMEWIEILMAKLVSNREDLTKVLPSNRWANAIRGRDLKLHARCLRPGCKHITGAEVNGYMVVKNGLNSLSGQKTEQVGTLPQSHQKLVDHYLHRPRPLHTRRTLDQYHYFSLDDEGITYRDETQTLSLHFIQSSGGSSTHEKEVEP
ncbi:hypothetical protein N656DRAFT_410271 [Canariomyces notabilis]|uniref:Ankyrin repeat protein n=1 Tax=Canariomyces notabilis TaxID=2074819 RepID=A0AAN6YWY2_9PEZI|nr:hypothetical protein N656DRAFT_410271 [Canariomyces arenarius]